MLITHRYIGLVDHLTLRGTLSSLNGCLCKVFFMLLFPHTEVTATGGLFA